MTDIPAKRLSEEEFAEVLNWIRWEWFEFPLRSHIAALEAELASAQVVISQQDKFISEALHVAEAWDQWEYKDIEKKAVELGLGRWEEYDPDKYPDVDASLISPGDEIVVRNPIDTSALASELAAKDEQIRVAREALETCKLSLKDWVSTYAPELCNYESVAESNARIGELGGLGYIATVNASVLKALAKLSTSGEAKCPN